jgi:hypothetical protein
MRIPVLAILTVAAVLTAAPARAQTFDPAYPVCIQIYDSDGGRILCGFNSLAQCAASASGQSAQCITNPYFAGARAPNSRRQRGAY